MVLPLPAQHREKLISMERPKQRQIKDILITLQRNLACQNSILNLRSKLYTLAIQLPKSTKIIAVSVCKTFHLASPPPAPKRRWRRLTAAEHTERILSEGAAGPPPITAPSAATAWALRILDVASRKQAKRAFRRLASRVHPDKSRHPAATEAMAMLTTAKQILEYYS